MSFQWENRLKNMMWTVSGEYEQGGSAAEEEQEPEAGAVEDRKSTRLNSSHRSLSRMPSSA